MPRLWIRSLFVLVCFLALIPNLALVKLSLKRRALSGRSVSGERYYLPPPRLLRALTFGYNELAADLVWLRTIAYFTDHLTTDRDFSNLKHYMDTIVALDDYVKEVYRFGASMFMSRGVRQTNEDVLAAIDLLKKAHQRFPKDPRYPFSIGAYYMAELRTRDPQKRAHYKRLGAVWIRRAALIGSDIPWLPSLAAKILTEQGQKELAIKHLQELYLTTKNPAMRAQIAAKLRTLQAANLAEQLDRYAQQFQQRYKASGLEFVPADLFVLLDAPDPPPFSISGGVPSSS
ncbi:MAG: hypothetical protein H6707_08730 [Deltaproteobacteria bacterium]|nr:hypothetical protein [Deltaproteobacteria bacterium]